MTKETTPLRPTDPDDVVVVIEHPHGTVEVPLRTWMVRGPGPRPLLRPVAVTRRGSGARLPLGVIPLRYRNDTWSRLFIRIGVLRNPW